MAFLHASSHDPGEGRLVQPWSPVNPRARTVEKFHWLAERHAERDLRDTIITTVAGVEHTPIPALTDLLTHVHLEEQR